MKALLLRYADTPFGVFGVLILYDHLGKEVLRLWTLEDDDLKNVPSLSCIPIGTYVCKRDVWHKYGVVVFQITSVPGRERILIHYGNTEEDVKGCVIVGLDLGYITVRDEDAPGQMRGKWAILQSRDAFDRLMKALDGVDTFDLEIRRAEPGEWRK